MSLCDCGCGFEVGSLEFIRLHVESEEEQEQRIASEEHLMRQETQEDYENLGDFEYQREKYD